MMQEHEIIELVQTKIYAIRNQKVMLDSDIAEIYGVETKRINEAVRNNQEKFPADFAFELNNDEQNLLRSKTSTLKTGRGKHRKYAPKAFTEQGVYMLATILKSPIATQVTIAIMRAFVTMRHFSLTYGQIVERLVQLNGKVNEHDDVLAKIIQALSELIQESQTEETKKIGFL
jgi:phage regulator Rha-like protein